MATKNKKESLTIDQYLKGCNCQTIYFNAGGCTLVLTNLEDEHSKLIQSDSGYEMLLGNDLTITRFYTEKKNKLIEIQIKAEYGHLFYMMHPTGTFIHKEMFE